LPAALEASEPPEARGLARDDVRLLVSDLEHDAIDHGRFTDLPRWVSAGDLLVVNASGTLNAALDVVDEQGEHFELRLSTHLPGGFWTVELRTPGPLASLPLRTAMAGRILRLPAGARATILAPYPLVDVVGASSRLWLAAIELPGPAPRYLARYGAPIRYSYVPKAWPSGMYQTIFATEPGSAEMPSAGRPFSETLVTRLVSAGVQIAPLVLHTGVSSLEDHERPYEEFFNVSRHTADQVNATRRAGGRVIAVGTTVVRALETVTDDRGTTSPGRGWTDLVISADHPLRAVNALITGLHEPRATHLMILEQAIAAAGRQSMAHRVMSGPLDRAYAEAQRLGYLWHEFGDAHLIIGARASSLGSNTGGPPAQAIY
jgi:S-adenosylmethionine:tRNA ribosyltransferase-isomerase